MTAQPRRGSRQRHGLTLIELLAATALLAALIIGVLGWLRLARLSSENAQARLVHARAVAATVRLIQDDLRLADHRDGDHQPRSDHTTLRLRTLNGASAAWVEVIYRWNGGELQRTVVRDSASPHTRVAVSGLASGAFRNEDDSLTLLIDLYDPADPDSDARWHLPLTAAWP